MAAGKQSPRRILVHQIGSLGDTLICLPAYHAVRRHYGPDAKISVLHDAHTDLRVTPLQVLFSSGLVDDHLRYPAPTSPKNRLIAAAQIGWQVVHRKFDAVVHLGPGQRTEAAVRRDRTFFRACGIPELIGFHAYSPSRFHARNAAGFLLPVPHEASLRLDRLRRDGLDVTLEEALQPPFLSLSSCEMGAAQQWLLENRRHPDRPLAAICPGAKQPANHWPVERFLEIGRRLLEIMDVELLVIGGPGDQKMGDLLIAAWGGGLNAAGSFSVTGSAALFRQCRFMIGLDTGTTHLAASVGVPCVALHGGKNPPGQWEPLGRGHIVLSHPVSCAGCGLTVCAEPNHPCMTGITVDQVVAAVQTLARSRRIRMIERGSWLEARRAGEAS